MLFWSIELAPSQVLSSCFFSMHQPSFSKGDIIKAELRNAFFMVTSQLYIHEEFLEPKKSEKAIKDIYKIIKDLGIELPNSDDS